MNEPVVGLLNSLKVVKTTDEFEEWARLELRRALPHAALLVTLGKLYGVGSVPTHRIGLDFPLNMVEALKNSAGALDDPLMYGWFRSEKPKFVQVDEVEEFGNESRWRRTLVRYGMRGVMIHGVLDHKARRFAVLQVCNPYGGGSLENLRFLSALTPNIALTAWGAIQRRDNSAGRAVLGHPTLKLTATEVQIVEYLAQGLSNKEIARRRGVSDSTVKTQVQRTGAKLGATRRAEIVAIALPMLSQLPPQSSIDYEGSEYL